MLAEMSPAQRAVARLREACAASGNSVHLIEDTKTSANVQVITNQNPCRVILEGYISDDDVPITCNLKKVDKMYLGD
jgi:hypothetical protein